MLASTVRCISCQCMRDQACVIEWAGLMCTIDSKVGINCCEKYTGIGWEENNWRGRIAYEKYRGVSHLLGSLK